MENAKLEIILKFISDTTANLAWPLAILTLALVFKAPMLKALKMVTSVKYAGAEVSFREEVEILRHDAAENGITLRYPTDVVPPIENPRSFVIEQWLQVERMLESFSARKNGKEKQFRAPRQTLHNLATNGIISGELASLVLKIHDIRNKAAHANDFELTTTEALELAGAIKSIKVRLKNALDAQDT